MNLCLDVGWYLPGHIISCYDVLSVEDRIERNKRILHLMNTEGQPPKIHLLIDFKSTDYGNYPVNLQEMTHLYESNAELRQVRDELSQHPLLGWVISIGSQNKTLTANANVMANKMQYYRRAVGSLEEALDFLKRVDSSLVDKLEGHE